MDPNSDKAIQLLQRYPQKINVLGQAGRHILHYACSFGHVDLLTYIFESPAYNIDFNVVDQHGETPLQYACMLGQKKVVKFLLEKSKEKGIDVKKENNLGYTAEDLARQAGHKDILELFALRNRSWLSNLFYLITDVLT